jgi:hypothetical protein
MPYALSCSRTSLFPTHVVPQIFHLLISLFDHLNLPDILLRTTRTPHPLQKPIFLRQPIQTVITLRSTPHESAERIHLVLACISAVLVDFADADLYGGVVFSFDDAVRCAAFAGDVAGDVSCVL